MARGMSAEPQRCAAVADGAGNGAGTDRALNRRCGGGSGYFARRLSAPKEKGAAGANRLRRPRGAAMICRTIYLTTTVAPRGVMPSPVELAAELSATWMFALFPTLGKATRLGMVTLTWYRPATEPPTNPA